MARGGYRPGSGRPKGTTRPKLVLVASPAIVPLPGEDALDVDMSGESPLGYMLRNMNDPAVPDTRRDRLAHMAAPFVHPRADSKPHGAKLQQAEAARFAGRGTHWGGDLHTPQPSAREEQAPDAADWGDDLTVPPSSRLS